MTIKSHITRDQNPATSKPAKNFVFSDIFRILFIPDGEQRRVGFFIYIFPWFYPAVDGNSELTVLSKGTLGAREYAVSV